jgi:hypothetical protein
MKNTLSLVVAVLLTFIAISLLMAALQYSSDLIGVSIQNDTTLTTDVNVHGLTNNTGEDSPDNSGALQAASPNSGGSGLNIINLSSLTSGGNPKKPDDPQDPTNYLLIILIILVVLVFLAIIGYLIWRRRRRRHSQKMPSGGAAAGISPAYFDGDYKIRFPQIREPFPIIWGENETLEVIIESKDGTMDEAVLDIDGKVTRNVRLDNGRALLGIEPGKGEHRITVGVKDGADISGPSWAIIRIVDYREEIVRMFNEMYLNYSSRYEGIGDKMTPRELELAIGLKMPETKRKALDVAVTIFELANYSLHAIRRKDYERMYVSKMDVT